MERTKDLFSKYQWAYLVGLILPVTIFHLILKGLRIFERGDLPPWWELLDLAKSELTFFAGLASLGVWCIGLVTRKWETLTLLGFQLLIAATTASNLVAHRFCISTGSFLDAGLIQFAIGKFDELSTVLRSEVSGGFVVVAATVFAAIAFAPWVVAWAFGGKSGQRFRYSGWVAAVGMGLLLCSAAPGWSSSSNAFGKVAVVHIAQSALAGGSERVEDVGRMRYGTEDARLTYEGDSSKRNIVFVVLESTRARSVTPYNPELETTPYLETLSEESLLAERAYTTVPHTTKAMVSMMCGIEPRMNMPITEAVEDGIPAKCLPELLDGNGYKTGFFTSSTKHFENFEQLVDNFGYEYFVPLERMDTAGFDRVNYFGREDEIMLEPSRTWLEEVRESPLAVTYLTLTPHHDYQVPDTYPMQDFAETDKVNRYLNAVYYVDRFTEKLIEQYKHLGLYRDTIFVVVGDHGEAFGEHGRNQHDNVMWEEGVRVPLLIHDPQRPDLQGRIEYPVNHLDLMPTVSNLLGFEIEGANLPGKDIRKVDSNRPLYTHCWYERQCAAKIKGDDKYIHHFDNRGDQFFDLAADPGEQNNIISTLNNSGRWRTDILEWRKRVNNLYTWHNRKKIDQYISREAPTPQVETDVRYGDYVRLVGYDLSRPKVAPGGEVEVTYYFEALRSIPAGWNLFVHGEGYGDMINLDHVPVDGLYPLQDWRAGEYVIDSQTIEIPNDWKTTELELYQGIYHEDQGRAPVSGDIPTDGERRAKILEIEVVESLGESEKKLVDKFVKQQVPDIEERKSFRIGDWIEFVGYEVSSRSVQPGESVTIRTVYRVEEDIPAGWKLFMHGVGSDEQLVNLDHRAVEGLYPVSRWKKEDIVVDEYTFSVPSDWQEDSIGLYLGVYHAEKGRANIGGNVQSLENRAHVTHLQVSTSQSPK